MGLKSHFIEGTGGHFKRRTSMNKNLCPSLFVERKKFPRANWNSRTPAVSLCRKHDRTRLLCRPVPIMVWQTHSWTKPIVRRRLDPIDLAKVRVLQKRDA
jgi:hypothetical protein